jgi:hypothetical protein
MVLTDIRGAGIAQSGWATEGSESRYSKNFSLLHVVQTGSGTHPASYPMSTGASFSGGRTAGL